jgi:hypothetical protein
VPPIAIEFDVLMMIYTACCYSISKVDANDLIDEIKGGSKKNNNNNILKLIAPVIDGL